jgi:hypothetical protein
MSSVDACRLIAAEIWRAERPHAHFGLSGLNSEQAVRERLQKLAMELEAIDELPDLLALQLVGVGWTRDEPLTLLEKTERMVSSHCIRRFTLPDDLLRDRDPITFQVARLLIVQCVAGRLGLWAVRTGEIPDARFARAMLKDVSDADWSEYRALIDASEELYRLGRHRDAAIALLSADRLVRTAAGLLQSAVSLTKAGDYMSALWAVRAALLEPKSAFESPHAYLKAHKIEGRLRAIIDGRSSVPLAEDEARLLAGEDPLGRPETTPPTRKHRELLEAELVEAPTDVGRVSELMVLESLEPVHRDDQLLADAIARADPFSNVPPKSIEQRVLFFSDEDLRLVSETFDLRSNDRWHSVVVDRDVPGIPRDQPPEEELTDAPKRLSSSTIGSLLDGLGALEPNELPTEMATLDTLEDEETTHQLSAQDMQTVRIRRTW